MKNKHQMFLAKQYDYKLGTLISNNYNSNMGMGVIVGYDDDNDPEVYYFSYKATLPEFRKHIEVIREVV